MRTLAYVPSKLYESTHPEWTSLRNLGHSEKSEVKSEKKAKVSGGARYNRAVERAAKSSHIDQGVHVDQEDHADICGSESDVLDSSDVESGTAVQQY